MKAFLVVSLFAFGLAPASAATGFDVVSIKPSVAGTKEGMNVQRGRFSANGFPLKFFISTAYHVAAYQIAGGDSWMTTDRWSIEATAGDAAEIPAWAPPYLPEVVAARVRALLEDRFALKSHREKRDVDAYVLTVSRKGNKLAPGDPAARGALAAGPGVIRAEAVTMEQFAIYLNRIMDLPVIDHTGLSDTYKFSLKFAPESAHPLGTLVPGAGPTLSSDPTIFDALDQIGLELRIAKEPVEVLVIDSAQKPAGN